MNLSLKHTVYTILVSTDEHAICISNQATTDSFLTLVKQILMVFRRQNSCLNEVSPYRNNHMIDR